MEKPTATFWLAYEGASCRLLRKLTERRTSMTVEQAVTTTSATKPVSALAQKVTAGAAVAIALLIVLGGFLIGAMVFAAAEGVDRTISNLADVDDPRVVRQAICLPYSDFVIRQRQAGLSTSQIQGVLDYAGHDGEGSAVDNSDVCGSPQSILDAAGIK